MGRRSVFDKSKLVSFDKKTNISTCLTCQKVFKGCLLGNIKRHYDKIHHYNFVNGRYNVSAEAAQAPVQPEESVSSNVSVVDDSGYCSQQPPLLIPQESVSFTESYPNNDITNNDDDEKDLKSSIVVLVPNEEPMSQSESDVDIGEHVNVEPDLLTRRKSVSFAKNTSKPGNKRNSSMIVPVAPAQRALNSVPVVEVGGQRGQQQQKLARRKTVAAPRGNPGRNETSLVMPLSGNDSDDGMSAATSSTAKKITKRRQTIAFTKSNLNNTSQLINELPVIDVSACVDAQSSLLTKTNPKDFEEKLVMFDNNLDIYKCLKCNHNFNGYSLEAFKQHYEKFHSGNVLNQQQMMKIEIGDTQLLEIETQKSVLNMSHLEDSVSRASISDPKVTSDNNGNGLDIVMKEELISNSEVEIIPQKTTEMPPPLAKRRQTVSFSKSSIENSRELNITANISQDSLDPVSPNARDDTMIYAEHIACKFRRYSMRTRDIVQHRINTILFQADMGAYDRPY